MLINKKSQIFIISILIITGFLVTSLTSYFVSRGSLRSEIRINALPLTSDNIYSEIQRDLLKPTFISSLMATDTFLRDWVLSGEKNIHQVSKYLNEIQIRYNTVSSFFVSDKTKNYYYPKGLLKKISPDNERDLWYFRVKKMTLPYEVNVDPDLANNDAMTIFINYRVFDYDKNFIGTTGVGLSVSSVKKLIKTYQEKYNRNIYFINSDGDVILSNKELNNSNIFSIDGLNKLKSKIIGTDIHSFVYKSKEGRFYLNTRYIPEFDWYLLVEQKDTTASKGIFKTLLINLAICFIITFIVIFFTNILINSYQGKLEKLAITDELTELYNRRAFNLIFNHIKNDINRKIEPLSVLLVDVDNFKEINDSFGHLAGDLVLQNVSKVINKNLRISDSVFRWGGDEFLLILKKCDINNAFLTAEKIRKRIKDSEINHSNKKIKISISIGVAEYLSNETDKKYFERIDKALYRAKEAGRNRTVKAELI